MELSSVYRGLDSSLRAHPISLQRRGSVYCLLVGGDFWPFWHGCQINSRSPPRTPMQYFGLNLKCSGHLWSNNVYCNGQNMREHFQCRGLQSSCRKKRLHSPWDLFKDHCSLKVVVWPLFAIFPLNYSTTTVFSRVMLYKKVLEIKWYHHTVNSPDKQYDLMLILLGKI